MGALFLLYVLRDRRQHHSSELNDVGWVILLTPLAIMVAAPYVWWVRARDAGSKRVTAAMDTVATAALPWVLGYRYGWWLVPLVLLVEGLVGLVAISAQATRERRREEAERRREESDWQAHNRDN